MNPRLAVLEKETYRLLETVLDLEELYASGCVFVRLQGNLMFSFKTDIDLITEMVIQQTGERYYFKIDVDKKRITLLDDWIEEEDIDKQIWRIRTARLKALSEWINLLATKRCDVCY